MLDIRTLYSEAVECRQKAMCYLGKPEAPFLLRVAGEFERLAEERSHNSEGNTDPLCK
jgi:hypothetical protein